MVLCDVNNVRATIGWGNFLLTNQLTVVALHCSEKVYIESPGPWCRPLLLQYARPEEVQEEEEALEIHNVNLEEEASSSNQRKRKISDDVHKNKVRLPYSCSSSASPTQDAPCPCLAQIPPQCTHILSKFSFPSSFTNVFLDDFVFLPGIKAHEEVKLNGSADSGWE